MNKLRVGILAAVVAAVGLWSTGCGQQSSASTGGQKRPSGPRQFLVRTELAATRVLKYEMEAIGSLQADDIYRIDAQLPGVLQDVNFREGAEVTPETVLARISPRTYELAAQKAKDAWQNALADLADVQRRTRFDVERTRLKLQQAQRDFDRRKPAYESGAVSADELSLYQDKRDLAAIELQDAEEAAKTLVTTLQTAAQQKETEWQQAEEDLRKSSVVAPVSGSIDARWVANGAQVLPGTPLAQVVSGGLRLKFSIPEKDSAHVRSQTPVTFRVMAHPGKQFAATTYFVSSLADPKSRLVTCWADVEPVPEMLKSGFFATVGIVTETKQQALVIPLTAAQPTERGFVVFVVEDGKARLRQVTLGLQVTDQAVEVVAGLTAGEVIVVEGANALQDGVPVRDISAEVTPEMAARQ